MANENQIKTKPVPVRLDTNTRARLRNAAKKMGSNSSAVIRFSILQQLPEIERGTIILKTEVA